MTSGFIARFRPAGPWRIGPDSGARDRVDRIYRSDSLYSAVAGAMALMGSLDAWLEATAANPAGSAVRFSSCYPYRGDELLVVPPRSVWPPLASPKVRWKGARFVPLPLIEDLVKEKPLNEDRWMLDGPSECLIAFDAHLSGAGPFRPALRSRASVDRLTGNTLPHATACLEFAPDCGLWAAVGFADEQAKSRWSEPVRAAFRILADSGFGGERSSGWGHSDQPEFTEAQWPDAILPSGAGTRPAQPEVPAGSETAEAEVPAEPLPPAPPALETAYWLLSLFSPSPDDAIDWQRGNYAQVSRGGSVESPVRWGARKKQVRMLAEGSVVLAAGPPRGAARDVAPDGFPHPVFRSGFAFAIPIPWRVAS
jgi:CRISPR type III-A-associated RAMP protein Csm4